MEGPIYVSDRIAPVHRQSLKELFFFLIESYPAPDSEEYGQMGGAYVNCWVDADDLRTAERRAVARIQEEGWRPYRLDTWKIVTLDAGAGELPGDSDDPEDGAIFAQAFAEGAALIFYTWPVGGASAELAH